MVAYYLAISFPEKKEDINKVWSGTNITCQLAYVFRNQSIPIIELKLGAYRSV